jgi:hypothetical protein
LVFSPVSAQWEMRLPTVQRPIFGTNV